MNRFLLALLSILYYTATQAQEPNFIRHEMDEMHTGVPINKMLQDHQCMIWLGTDKGLSRYDGIALKDFFIDSTSNPSQVTSLMEDGEGKIWVGTASGKIFYLDLARKIHVFNIEEGNPAKEITAITQDHNGQIWFATYGEGVYVYTGSRLFNFNTEDGLNGNDIYAMTLTTSGEIWMGTDDGINICSFSEGIKSVSSIGLKEGLPDQIVTALKADSKGNVWIGTFENGVVQYNNELQKIEQVFAKEGMDEITSFDVFDDEELWIGTRKNGAWKYNPDLPFVTKVSSISERSTGEISDILADVEGNIWLAMEGLLFSAFRPFETLQTDIGDIQTLYCDTKERLWIGSRNGLYRLEKSATKPSTAKRVASGYDMNITDIFEDKFHNLWIGTLDKGLYIYNPDNGVMKHPGANGISSNTIMSMAMSKEFIWVATLRGVISYPIADDILSDRDPHFELLNDPWQSTLHFVFQIFVDSKDRVWFATDGNGVYALDGSKVTQHEGVDSISLKTVYSICEDQRGHLWFNIPDFGLVEYDGIKYIPLGLAEGLRNTNVASIATAGTGDILISHQRGIDLLEPERRHFMYYAEDVRAKEIDPGLNSVTTDSNGHVYISGNNTILKYYSAKTILSIHPWTLLTQVSVFDQPVDHFITTQFPYNKNYISFDYIGIWYTSPKSVTYQYKLEGYDRQWKVSKDNQASYSSLPPGDYTFYVKASENKFFLDEPITSYSFSIARPFWLQLWFITLLLALGGFLFYMIVKSREKRSERQALIKKEMLESQLQALKAQINPHFLFNSFNTLITLIDENAHQPDIAIEYVEKLSDFFRSILQYREHESISLEEEWKLVQNFGYLLKKRYGENLRLHMDSPPMEDACILPLTLQMLVENAVKHNVISESKPLDVHITIDEDDYITVKNNLQLKSKPEVSTRFGLQSIAKRYNLLSEKKVMIIQDHESFKVRIPIIKIKNHEDPDN